MRTSSSAIMQFARSPDLCVSSAQPLRSSYSLFCVQRRASSGRVNCIHDLCAACSPQDRGGRQLIYDLCSQHRNCNFLGYAVKKILSAGVAPAPTAACTDHGPISVRNRRPVAHEDGERGAAADSDAAHGRITVSRTAAR